MQHRDVIIIRKIISEIDFAMGRIKETPQESFIEDPELKEKLEKILPIDSRVANSNN